MAPSWNNASDSWEKLAFPDSFLSATIRARKGNLFRAHSRPRFLSPVPIFPQALSSTTLGGSSRGDFSTRCQSSKREFCVGNNLSAHACDFRFPRATAFWIGTLLLVASGCTQQWAFSHSEGVPIQTAVARFSAGAIVPAAGPAATDRRRSSPGRRTHRPRARRTLRLARNPNINHNRRCRLNIRRNPRISRNSSIRLNPSPPISLSSSPSHLPPLPRRRSCLVRCRSLASAWGPCHRAASAWARRQRAQLARSSARGWVGAGGAASGATVAADAQRARPAGAAA